VHLQDLMHHVAQEERHANKYGYVWSVTEALIVKGYAEAEKGNEKIAKQLFYEAKLQFELSVEQAKYAEQNWTLLVPEEY
jgi:predicted NAD/FAD-dependent oxidoreductase